MKFLAYQLLKIGERISSSSYLKEQVYDVKYVVGLKNVVNHDFKTELILPIAKNFEGQEIIESPSFNPNPRETEEEPEFGNQYAAWKLNLKPGEEKEIKETFKVKIQPSIINAKTGVFKVSDYKKDECFELFSRPNDFIHPDDEIIKKLAAKIIGKKTDVIKILKVINRYVVTRLKYGKPIEGLYSDIDAISNNEVDCGGFAALYTSLAIASGVPSRIVAGFWAGYENNTMHAWAESLLPDGTLLPVDPATEHLRRRGRTKKFGEFGKVGSDRIIFSKGCDFKLSASGKEIKAEILQNPIVPARPEEIKCEWVFKSDIK